MSSNQQLCCLLHGMDVKRTREVAGTIRQHRTGRPSKCKRVTINFAQSVKTGVKTGIYLSHQTHLCVVGQPSVHSHHDGLAIQACFNINMRRHGQSVYAAISSTRAMHCNLMSQQVLQGDFEGALNAARSALTLPPKETRAVVFNRE